MLLIEPARRAAAKSGDIDIAAFTRRTGTELVGVAPYLRYELDSVP